ncbi:nucleotide sugar dehydrogenase [Acinetobacter puyangensis]|uniref:UDP-glucose 6-dehydrogenase n=1 Tax=Acinetobacter puyangensis TaxID=1096779 RepID=A0A240E4U0_9GAMM|nr:nucleotide sugar dehydrogenase [Acinetobacter puyangensis]SNX43541.1 UDPglucose 6-dehydrogenase [Acinetobacter puyangensis]
MYIQIIGASVNAAVIAYHLADVGHKIFWQPQDEALLLKLQQRQIIFDDVDLTMAVNRQLESSQIAVDQCGLSDVKVCILALAYEQYGCFEQQDFSRQFKQFDLVINYSHLALGKTEELKLLIANPNVVYIPDFLQEGNLLRSFLTPNLIIGCESGIQIKLLVQEIFRPIFPLLTQYNFMSVRAAEFTKLSISGFLATKVSFMNDLSNAAEALGVDIEEVRVAMSTDTRIGKQYLYPGCGFGGGNLTRDVLTLKEVVQETGSVNGLLDKIWDINEYQKEIIFRKLWTLFDCQLKDKVIAFWGAAFKPNTNSLAQAPILNILEACWAQGAITQVHDPRALENLRQHYPDQPLLVLCDHQYQAVENADALCLVTEWKQYWSPDYIELRQKMKRLNLIDGRNIYNPQYVKQQGFHYLGIGR